MIQVEKWTFFILCTKNRFFTLNARKTGFEHVIMLGILSFTLYLKHKIQHENWSKLKNEHFSFYVRKTVFSDSMHEKRVLSMSSCWGYCRSHCIWSIKSGTLHDKPLLCSLLWCGWYLSFTLYHTTPYRTTLRWKVYLGTGMSDWDVIYVIVKIIIASFQ